MTILVCPSRQQNMRLDCRQSCTWLCKGHLCLHHWWNICNRLLSNSHLTPLRKSSSLQHHCLNQVLSNSKMRIYRGCKVQEAIVSFKYHYRNGESYLRTYCERLNRQMNPHILYIMLWPLQILPVARPSNIRDASNRPRSQPPYSSLTLMPANPRLAAFFSTSLGKIFFSSHSLAWGASSYLAKS